MTKKPSYLSDESVSGIISEYSLESAFMNSIIKIFQITVLIALSGLLVAGVGAQNIANNEQNATTNLTLNMSSGNGEVYDDTNQSEMNQADSNKTNENSTPEVFTGVVYPDEEPGITSSTPEGNPLIPKYAQGGVSIDLMGHSMEARGDGANVSSDMSFHDQTDAFGYINTIMKEFHYESGVDTQSGI